MKLVRLIKYSTLAVCVSICAATSSQSAKIENYEAEGNLAATQPIGCVNPS